MKKIFFMCLFVFFIPSFSHAAVTINEIAWMGSSVSANDEWIELYNSGSQSVSLDGWILSDGMNLEIALYGAIGAGQYAVLERTDDSSAQGTAFLIYTGALANIGATLSLYRADNSMEDRVVGGENWENIGGDNVTKETAQYTTAGWVTSVPTPGKVNTITPNTNPVTPEETSINTTTNTKKKSSGTSVKNTPASEKPRVLQSVVTVPSRVYINQEVSMSVQSSGLGKSVLNSLEQRWNFGDMNTTTGKEVQHRFAYPGEYVVTVQSTYKKYQTSTRKNITVLPVAFSITLSPSGDVQVHNNARYEVDVSGYKITAGKIVTFPDRTILLPNSTITIPKEKISFIEEAVLYDDIAMQVASYPTVSMQPEETVVREVVQSKTPAPSVAYAPIIELLEIKSETNENFTFTSEENIEKENKEQKSVEVQIETKSTNTQQVATPTPIESTKDIPNKNEKLPYYALLAVIAIGITGVYLGRKR